MSTPFGTNNPGIGGLDELTSVEETIIASIASLGAATNVLAVNGAGTGVEWVASGGFSLTVEEGDASPSVTNVDTIVFPNGTVTDDGGGQVTISISGSGDVTAASNFGTDNVLVKSDGTGKGVQATGISIADTTNDISGVGDLSMGGYIDLDEITTPANPSANIGRLYVKDASGTTKLYFRDSSGTETDLLSGAGAGDAWSDPVDADIIPDTDSTRDIGTTLNRFAEGYFDDLTAGQVNCDGDFFGQNFNSLDGNAFVGFSSNDIQLSPKTTGVVTIGRTGETTVIESNGAQDITIQTGNATTGSISIIDGANGNINIAPNGTGEAQVSGQKIIDETDTASTTAAGIVELATGAEAVTGTDATRAVTPDALTDRLADPGSLGTTDPVTEINYDVADGTVSALGNLGATEVIDWSTAVHFTGNLDSNISITHTNEVSGRKITLYLSYLGAQRIITWTDVDEWLDNNNGSAPTAPVTTGDVLVVTMQFIGTTCYASATGNYAVYS